MTNSKMINPIIRPLTLSPLMVLFAGIVSFGALLYSPSPGWAATTAPDLGTASNFAVLGGTNVTCTAPGSIIGDVGVSPRSFTPGRTNKSAISYQNELAAPAHR